MITDNESLDEIRRSWSVVEKLSTNGLYTRATSSGFIQVDRPDDSFSLPFVLAYAVLDQVLTILRDQGEFRSKSSFLGPKMEASENVLPWQCYYIVSEGKTYRNELAHEAVLVKKADALRFIAAIRQELIAWNIL